MQFYAHTYKANDGGGDSMANIEVAADDTVHLAVKWSTIRIVLDIEPGEALAMGRQLTRAAEHALDAGEGPKEVLSE